MSHLPLFIIISGMTSSGKDTIKHALLQKYPHMKGVITTTTRPMRKREVNGEDLHFISKEEFEKKLSQNEFIEHVEYAGNLYGTEKREILDNLDHDLIWRIDPSRAAQIKELIKENFDDDIANQLLSRLVVIFIKIDEDLARQRLTSRGLEESEIERRLLQDRDFWSKYYDKYDHVIENPQGKLDQTIEKVLQIINSAHQ